MLHIYNCECWSIEVLNTPYEKIYSENYERRTSFINEKDKHYEEDEKHDPPSYVPGNSTLIINVIMYVVVERKNSTE